MNNKTKYTLITGASSGMGEATAKLLSQSRNLVLNGRNEQRLKAVCEECSRNGANVVPFHFDLENAADVGSALAQLIKDNALQVGAFVHFAGMTEVLPVAKTKYSIGLKVMNVNYFSATEIISTLLKKRINGDALDNILLTGSIVTQGGKSYQPHYCSSKGAITSLGLALACELAPRVRVNIISPGSFRTRIIQTVFADVSPDAPWNPPTRLAPGTVEDVAKTVRFLLSDDASYITGNIITLDGGEHFPKL